MEEILIHPTAIIDPEARLDKTVKVGAYSIIGPEVVIGAGTVVDSHVIIKGDCTIGRDNKIGAYSTIGFPAQDKDHINEPTKVVIGDRNDIREYVSVHTGTLGGTGVTKIGNDNQIMVHCHFAHDSSIGDNCMLANATTLAGHVEFGSYIVTGGLTAFHQFCRVGSYSMIGGVSGVSQDISPFMIASGQRAKLYGINRVGLSRKGFSKSEVREAYKIYKIFFRSGINSEDAVKRINNEISDGRVRKMFLDFISSSKRSLAR